MLPSCILNSFIFDDISKANIKLSKDSKYLIYKKSKDEQEIYIYNIKTMQTIVFDDKEYRSLLNIDFQIIDDTLFIIGTWMKNGGSHNFVKYDLLTQTVIDRKNCSIGNRITSYYLTHFINSDFIATVGVLGGMDSYKRFMLIRTNGEFINWFEPTNITKFVPSNDGKYLLMANETNDNELKDLYFIDCKKEFVEENIINYKV